MLTNHLNSLLRRFVVKSSTLERANKEINALSELLRFRSNSQSEYFQDIWVAKSIGRDGFFVEFGAADGRTISNTYLLESELGWNGILAEPCRAFHPQLAKNRTCIIDHRAVWTSSGDKLTFSESKDAFLSGVSSTQYLNAGIPTTGTYPVVTVTLSDLLKEHNAPRTIDFLSIDTEGGETEILKDFLTEGDYHVKLICIEHSWRREDNHLLGWMHSKGFRRVYENIPSRDFWFENTH
jgi:FkbM family methyltransferase